MCGSRGNWSWSEHGEWVGFSAVTTGGPGIGSGGWEEKVQSQNRTHDREHFALCIFQILKV